jgi:hypothetical protein
MGTEAPGQIARDQKGPRASAVTDGFARRQLLRNHRPVILEEDGASFLFQWTLGGEALGVAQGRKSARDQVGTF